MKKEILLRHIAETAYNVGFGAKIHFATYEIVSKTSVFINIISIIVGIIFLGFRVENEKIISIFLLCIGVIGIYLYSYDDKKDEYLKLGKELTKLFNDLKLVFEIAQEEDCDLDNCKLKLSEIEYKYNEISISKQIFLSNWFAHYKFFWEQQIGWIDNILHFKLFRDKIPLSLTLTVFIVIGSILVA